MYDGKRTAPQLNDIFMFIIGDVLIWTQNLYGFSIIYNVPFIGRVSVGICDDYTSLHIIYAPSSRWPRQNIMKIYFY